MSTKLAFGVVQCRKCLTHLVVMFKDDRDSRGLPIRDLQLFESKNFQYSGWDKMELCALPAWDRSVIRPENKEYLCLNKFRSLPSTVLHNFLYTKGASSFDSEPCKMMLSLTIFS